MSENDPAFPLPANASIAPPSTDLQRVPATAGEAAVPPEWHPELELPERPLAQKPRWPHPSFGWALLWCLLFEIVTQLPGAFILGGIITVLSLVWPKQFPLESFNKLDKFFQSAVGNASLAVVFIVTEMLVVGFSWLIIRLVVGRDWTRQLAVRRPSLAHTLLALASFPVLALLGNVSYELLRASRWVPCMSDATLLEMAEFWASVFVVLNVAVLASWLLAGFGWTRRLAARPTRPADILIVAAVLPLLLVSILALYEGIRRVFPGSGMETLKPGGGMEDMVKVFATWPWGLAVLVIGLGPGIGEELWCRGFLGRGLVGNHGAVLGVLASSFCFGLIHGDPCQGTMAMVMGLWLHFVYLMSRSLWLPMLLHFLNNSLGVLAPRFSSLELLDSPPQNIPLFVYLTAALVLIGVAYALYQSRARLEAKMPGPILAWRPAFEGVEYPPTESGTQVVHPSPSPAAVVLAGGAFLLFVLACVAWAYQG